MNRVRKDRWTDADQDFLVYLRESRTGESRMAWEDISRVLTNSNPQLGIRTPAACEKRYYKICNKARDLWPWTASEEQLLFSLRKAGYPLVKVSDEFPDRKKSGVIDRWRRYMGTPVDYEDKHEWKPSEDLQLGQFQREGYSWTAGSKFLPGHRAGECLVQFLKLHGSLPYPCPSNSAIPWGSEEKSILISMRNK